MRVHQVMFRSIVVVITVALCATTAPGDPPFEVPADFDDDGWVGVVDHAALASCLAGPGVIPNPPEPLTVQACLTAFDADEDADVDVRDLQALSLVAGHTPIVLKDQAGHAITATSTAPMSHRQTCGGCHDMGDYTQGFHFQQGRMDSTGQVVTQADYFGDGRPHIQSAGMYGGWLSYGMDVTQLAPKTNTNESTIDGTSYLYVQACGICHPGGGRAAYDRDGFPYYDALTGQFGYELAGRDPTFDGDYAHLDPETGEFGPAPWDVTGVPEADCLYCHRRLRGDGMLYEVSWYDRAALLLGGANVVDDNNQPVPAFAAAATAGQGWYSTMETWVVDPCDPPVATQFQIDYGVGVEDGGLVAGSDGSLALADRYVTRRVRDVACWGCHQESEEPKRGQVWFGSSLDVHYAGLNHLTDEDPGNDIAWSSSTACVYCHPGDGQRHTIAKGRAWSNFVNDETDFVGFRTCRDCHLAELSPGIPNSLKDPAAPAVESGLHFVNMGIPTVIDLIACQTCHIPYVQIPADLVYDDAVTGDTVQYLTEEWLSSDPLDPQAGNRSRWYPRLQWKEDRDGVRRLFPSKLVLTMYWADWDRGGTPDDYSDDTITPIPLWKVRHVTGMLPLPGVTDDNGDWRYEVNRPAEILTYIQALKGDDGFGRPIATNP